MENGQKLGKYTITKTLGEGAMGIVYQAYDPDLDISVAIKTIHPNLLIGEQGKELLLRFKQEARIAAKLAHASVVIVHNFIYSSDQDTHFIVMELVNGQQLNNLEDISIKQTTKIIENILHAVKHVHSNNVVHRDLKPSNIFVLADDSVKIADFGVAKVDDSELTYSGAVLGTPAYMAPEQFIQEVDSRADIFSIGVIFYELLTRTKPFSGKNIASDITHKIPEKPSAIDPAIPISLDKVIYKALEKSRDNRFQNTEEFLNAIPKENGSTILELLLKFLNKNKRKLIFFSVLAVIISIAFKVSIPPNPNPNTDISSIPSNVDILLDNKRIGVTPKKIFLEPDGYNLILRKRGYQDLKLFIEVESKKFSEFNFTLEPTEKHDDNIIVP